MPNCTDHLANERTFLAWIRTSLGIMVFGFVVEKFDLFVKPLAGSINNSVIHEHAIFGVVLICFGALVGFLSFIHYKKVQKQINNNRYESSSLLTTLLGSSIVIIGALLLLYLI